MPTFLDLANYVYSDMSPDLDTQFPKVTGAFSASAFGKRLAVYLVSFSRETCMFYTPGAALTVEEGDREISLDNPSKCALSIYDARRVWISNQEIAHFGNWAEIVRRWSPLDQPGRPAAFAQMNETICFDVAASEDFEDCFIQGWYRHPLIASDSDAVLVPVEYWTLFSRYAQVYMRETTVNDDVGLGRLTRFDAKAAKEISRLRARYLARYMSDGGVC